MDTCTRCRRYALPGLTVCRKCLPTEFLSTPAILASSAEDDVETEDDEAALPETATIIIATEGEQTGDYRIVEPGALTWREPPLSLTINHNPDRIAGRIDSIRRDGDSIVGEVTFDLGGEEGREAARMVEGGFLRGVSMEIGDETVEFECLAEDDEGFCTQQLMRVLAGRIGAVTLTPFQAIESARVVTTASILLASAANGADVNPIEADSSWFANPGLDGPTPLVVTDDGRVYGHGAYWGVCHTGIADRCVLAPRSRTGYADFNRKPRRTTDGEVIALGTLTFGGLHAPTNRRMSAAEVVRYYEDTSTVFADVACGEDEFGVWVAGRLRSYITDEQVEQIRGAELSGDWRNGELVMLHAVVAPGFPASKVLVASGEVVALVASFTGCTECGHARADDLGDRVERLEAVVASLGLDAQAVDALAASLLG